MKVKNYVHKLLLFIVINLSFTNLKAQDIDNPWAINIGVNAIDFYPSHLDSNTPGDGYGEWFNEFFNVKDHYNMIPSVSKISISRYLRNDFSLEVSGTLNNITKLGDNKISNTSYYGLDGALKYDLHKLVSETSKFNPYTSLGFGYTWLGNLESTSLNGSLGLNYWLTERLGLNLESKLKYTFNFDLEEHFQHSFGIVFKFGGFESDGDGIYDKKDNCPEVFGLKEFGGCPDSDNDGIIDSKDACPEIAGIATFNGCPDTDKDGVPDSKDKCPNIKGLRKNNGCPDTDRDGVIDKDDNCPEIAGVKENKGCPALEKQKELPKEFVEVREQILMNINNIYFDLNSSYLTHDSKLELNKVVQIMLKHPTLIVKCGSYTDSRASDKYNLWLSERRAMRTVDYITSKGISPNRISGKGFGETQLINKCVDNVKCSNAEHQENRRTEIIVVNPEVIE